MAPDCLQFWLSWESSSLAGAVGNSVLTSWTLWLPAVPCLSISLALLLFLSALSGRMLANEVLHVPSRHCYHSALCHPFKGIGFVSPARNPPLPLRMPGVILTRISGFKTNKQKITSGLNRISLYLNPTVSMKTEWPLITHHILKSRLSKSRKKKG